MLDERAVEVGAEALYWRLHASGRVVPLSQRSKEYRAHYRNASEAILQALLDAGYTIVPPVEGRVNVND